MKPIQWQVMIILLVFLTAGGCGKKGDPFVRGTGFSAEVQELGGAWDGLFIVLWGELNGVSHGRDTGADMSQGARVYYGAYDPAQPPCETCPVRYQGYHEFGVEVFEGGGFTCRIPGKRRDALYFFKVHLIGPEGGLGPASQRVRIDRSES